MTNETARPVIFVSYAQKDEPRKPKPGEVQWRTYVQSYLAPAVLNGLVHIWVDEGIRGGEKWKTEIQTQLKECSLFILLVSVNSLASEAVVNFEIKTIKQRLAKGESVHIYPIVLKPFPRKAVPWLMELNLRPKSGRPLSEFSPRQRDKEMAAIADEIVGIVENFSNKKNRSKSKIKSVAKKIVQATIKIPGGHTSIDVGHLPETAYERLVGRDTELKRLDNAWSNSKINILSLIAEGGAGKSALVNEWLKRLQTGSYRSAEAVLGWSFYSQGSKVRATSADEFLNWSLEKLGIRLENTSTTAKGEAIAEAMVRRRVLLLLDGVEPLQHGPGPQFGQLKDIGLRALLRRLAAVPSKVANGLIVLSSRVAIKDIARWRDSSAPIIDVERLSDAAGAALLRDNGIWGTDKELKAATHDFGGHPLALGLLASFLKETQAGDIRRRDHIRGLIHDKENPRHDHAKRVMESYEKEWLTRQSVLLAIMLIVGLFDRPASSDCLQALCSRPVITDITDDIVDLGESEWQRAVTRLREARLLAPQDPSAPDALDAHPLVREWFGERLQQTAPDAWTNAHGRLYEHLRDTTHEGQNPTLEELAPLYQAIAHGCRAGRYRDALDKIYRDRICRWQHAYRVDERYGYYVPYFELEFYSRFKLGASDSDLATISLFFERPYDTPVGAITRNDQWWLISEAAYLLRSNGRLKEALSAERVLLTMNEGSHDWNRAAIDAANLTKLLLSLGQIDAALKVSKDAITQIERNENNGEIDPKTQIMCRAANAFARYISGDQESFIERFAEAESIQEEFAGQSRFFSESGFLYCDLLLGDHEFSAAKSRAERSLARSKQHSSLLGHALDAVTLGRAALGNALMENDSLSVHESRVWLNEAIDKLRSAGDLPYLPRGLLARAAFSRSVGEWDGAMRDLEEAEEVAEQGPMQLYLCDMSLERVRLALAQIEAFAPLSRTLEKENSSKPAAPSVKKATELKSEAKKQLNIAADYIKVCGYHRRDEELAELQAVLRGEKKFADLPPRV
jgi:tetratricopeptide (TPR) repeat protein